MDSYILYLTLRLTQIYHAVKNYSGCKIFLVIQTGFLFGLTDICDLILGNSTYHTKHVSRYSLF